MENSRNVAVVDIDTISSSSESSDDSKEKSTDEQQIAVNKENSSESEVTEQSSIASINLMTLAEMGYKTPEFQDFNNQTAKTDLYEQLQSMIRENKRPDLIVNIGETQFRVYSIVMQCYSDIFFKIKNATCVNLPPERVTPKSFKILYEWMITEKPISVPSSELLHLLDASSFLLIKHLTEQSLDYFNDESIMTDDKAFLTYLESKKRNFEFSKQFLAKRIKKFFLTLVAYEEFVKLDLLDICVILNSSNIAVNSELEIFMAAIRWLSYDWNARKEHTYKLMECVRFNLVPPWLLTTVQSQNAVEEVTRVVSISSVRQLINESITFTSTRLFYANDEIGFSKFVRQRGLFTPLIRRWIYDKDCSYHHKHSCRHLVTFDYKDFMKYLKELRKKHKDYWQTLDSSESGECKCGRKSEGIPDIFKTNLSFLYSLDNQNLQENVQKSNSQEQEEITTSPPSIQDDDTSDWDDTSHTNMHDDTCVLSVQEGTGVSSVQNETSVSSVQEDTLPSSLQEYISPSGMKEYISPSSLQKDKLDILQKCSTIVKMAENEILNQSVTQEPKIINTKYQKPLCDNLSSDNSVYWYEEKRVLKLTSSQSIQRKQPSNSQDKSNKNDQQKMLKKTNKIEMINEQNVSKYRKKK